MHRFWTHTSQDLWWLRSRRNYLTSMIYSNVMIFAYFTSSFVVKTGKYRAGDETRAGIVPPDEVYESFSDFVDRLLK